MKKIYLVILFLFSKHLQGQITSRTFGLGYTKGVQVTASSNSNAGINTLTLDGFLPNTNAASRFLSQATLGVREADIQYIVQNGIESWMNTQLNLPNSFSLENYIKAVGQTILDSLAAQPNPPEPPLTFDNLNLGPSHFDAAWFQGCMTAPDRLRWRVAYALSEIFVISRISDFDEEHFALSSFYDVLLNRAFGNYRDLLQDITYHPAMAVYLTFMNNRAQGIVNGNFVFPDENYAREIMQLFSIGLFELNLDGSEKKDGNGNPIPTYTNDDIAGLAKVFTGLSWQNSRYIGERSKTKLNYTFPLKFFPLDSSDAIRNPWKTNPTILNAHEPGPKTFLGYTIPARPVAQGEQDIAEALDVLFNHPNVGPFLARRLIQRLVTSNPSPEYISRVATIFNNNGFGTRGDLGAVVRAILLDPEARVINYTPERYAGKLREPFLRYTQLVHALDLTATGGVYRNRMSEVYEKTEQRPLNANSVFNFYLPDYMPDGELAENGFFAPEFQILNSITLTGYLNALSEWLVDNDPIDYFGYPAENSYKENQEPRFDFEPLYALSSNNKIPILIDKFNMLLTHGQLSDANLETITNTIKQMPEIFNSNGSLNTTNADRRVKLCIYLIMTSPDYLILK